MADHVSSTPTETPNVVITDPDTRRRVGNVLYVVLVVAAAASLFFAVFPELEGLYFDRVLFFVNSLVMLIGASFGIFVTRPNVPKLD